MKSGVVTGKVWATKRLAELPTGALLQVRLDDSQDVIVALDPLGCGEGERVLVTRGDMAARWCGQARGVVDALVVASLD